MTDQIYSVERITLVAGEVLPLPGSFKIVGVYQMVTAGGTVLASISSRENSGSQRRFVLDPGLYIGPIEFDEVTLENPGVSPITFDLLRAQSQISDNRLVLTAASVLQVSSLQLPAALGASGGMMVEDLVAARTGCTQQNTSITGSNAGATWVTRAANVNGIIVFSAAIEWDDAGAVAGDWCALAGDDFAHFSNGVLLAFNHKGMVPRALQKPIFIPPGLGLSGFNSCAGVRISRVSLGYKVL